MARDSCVVLSLRCLLMSRPDSNGEILLNMASRCVRSRERACRRSFTLPMTVRDDDDSPRLLKIESMKLQPRFQLEKEGEVVGSVT